MAWDATLPASSTKIRNGPTVITDNWSAIETADSSFKPYAINLINRSTIAVTADPTTIATASLLYCKSDGSNPELFNKDPAGNVIQLTKSGFILPYFAAVSFQSSGTIDWNYNCSTSNRPSTGIYDFTFDNPSPTAQYYIMCTPLNTGSPRTCTSVVTDANGFRIIMWNTDTGAVANNAGQVIVFGSV